MSNKNILVPHPPPSPQLTTLLIMPKLRGDRDKVNTINDHNTGNLSPICGPPISLPVPDTSTCLEKVLVMCT